MTSEDTKHIENASGSSSQQRLRSIPSVDRVLAHPALEEVMKQLPHGVVTMAVRSEVEGLREELLASGRETPDLDQVAERAASRARAMASPSLRPAINATGVVIHTNLGRAPLSRSAVEAIAGVAAYGNLEYDLEAGERGSRYVHAVQILRRVTGCEDALVVNNNAAALVLVLSALAAGREAVVSRGQLVEIGGGFRIPEIMRQSGAQLVEVGTTNRTYVQDYAAAVTPNTAVMLRVHASNFRIVGFTTAPHVGELATLAHEHDLVMVDDVGSGALLDTTRYGLAPEPMVQESLKAGVDLVLFSGDKLLGGPQCGVITGRSAYITRLKRHPLARALRVDKLTLAALEATLLHYLRGEAEREVPVWRMIAASPDELKSRAERWAARLSEAGIECAVAPGASAVGGGSLPGETLSTWVVSITPAAEGDQNAEAEAGERARLLRQATIPIIARIERGTLLLDPRTVLPHEEETLLAQIVACLKRET